MAELSYLDMPWPPEQWEPVNCEPVNLWRCSVCGIDTRGKDGAIRAQLGDVEYGITLYFCSMAHAEKSLTSVRPAP